MTSKNKTKNEFHWVEFEVIGLRGDPNENSVGAEYTIWLPNGEIRGGSLDEGALAHEEWEGAGGLATFAVKTVHSAKWSKAEVKVGEAVKMEATVEGFLKGTPAVFKIYLMHTTSHGKDILVATLENICGKSSVKTSWKPKTTGIFYFEVYIENKKSDGGGLEVY